MNVLFCLFFNRGRSFGRKITPPTNIIIISNCSLLALVLVLVVLVVVVELVAVVVGVVVDDAVVDD